MDPSKIFHNMYEILSTPLVYLKWTYNRILVEVIVGPSSDGVELYEIVKCGNLSPHPLRCQARLLEETSWLLDADTIQVGRP